MIPVGLIGIIFYNFVWNVWNFVWNFYPKRRKNVRKHERTFRQQNGGNAILERVSKKNPILSGMG